MKILYITSIKIFSAILLIEEANAIYTFDWEVENRESKVTLSSDALMYPELIPYK
jgi:hypothetical protein